MTFLGFYPDPNDRYYYCHAGLWQVCCPKPSEFSESPELRSLNDEFEECKTFSNTEEIEYPPHFATNSFYDAQLWTIRAFMLVASIMPLVALGSREFYFFIDSFRHFWTLTFRILWKLHPCPYFHDYFWSIRYCCDFFKSFLCYGVLCEYSQTSQVGRNKFLGRWRRQIFLHQYGPKLHICYRWHCWHMDF